LGVQLTGEAQVEIGRVGQDGKVRAPLFGRAYQLAELAVDAWNVGRNFHNSNHCERASIHHRFDPSGLHPRTGAAKEFGLGMPPLQGRGQARSVQVARSLARRDQYAH
jgi:hypothetical protein